MGFIHDITSGNQPHTEHADHSLKHLHSHSNNIIYTFTRVFCRTSDIFCHHLGCCTVDHKSHPGFLQPEHQRPWGSGHPLHSPAVSGHGSDSSPSSGLDALCHGSGHTMHMYRIALLQAYFCVPFIKLGVWMFSWIQVLPPPLPTRNITSNVKVMFLHGRLLRSGEWRSGIYSCTGETPLRGLEEWAAAALCRDVCLIPLIKSSSWVSAGSRGSMKTI